MAPAVDWDAGVVRVRRNYTRGQFASPKICHSSRAVAMADRLAAEVERHFQRSQYTSGDDLVFCHPQTGGPYEPSKACKRFKKAARTEWPALAAMERGVGNLRVRTMGSIGGNLCFADPHSDPATFLLALDGALEARRGGGEPRRIRSPSS